MQTRELRQLNDQQLIDRYEDLKEAMYKLRIDQNSGELVDTSQFRNTRREIARVLTILRERELAAAYVEEES